jgi:serine/threonine-protein kinase
VSLDHPNIVQGLDYGTGPRPYLAMERVQGHTLGHIRYFQGAMNPADVLYVGSQTARALEAVHRAGLVHRDVQPENIIVTPQGTAKLLDLGVAAHADPRKPAVTPDDLVTRGYAAPERLPGRFRRPQRGTPQSDLYSLGVLLHEMTTGKLLFAREDGSSDRSHSPAPLTAAAPEVPQELSDLVAELLQHDPAERLNTAFARSPSPDLDHAQEVGSLAEPVQFNHTTHALTGLNAISAATDRSITLAEHRVPARGEPTQRLHDRSQHQGRNAPENER